MTQPVLIPLLNPNEPEARLVALHAAEGQRVAKGDPLCTLETTKSTAEVLAEQDGYVVGLGFVQGQIIQSGEVLCYLAEEADWKPPAATAVTVEGRGEPLVSEPPDGLRITQPALALARQAGLELSRLPQDRLVTENMVRQLLEKEEAGGEFASAGPAFDAATILIYGGGGHGKSLIDLIRSLGGYQIIGVIDDGLAEGEQVLGVPLLGGAGVLPELQRRGVRLAANAVGGIGNLASRVRVFNKLAETGFVCPVLIHPTAYVEPSAQLSAGVHVFPHAYIGSQAQIGFGCIVNTGAIVSHDCVLGDYANISPGAMLAGEVQLGRGVLVGMGATLNLRVKVGAGARIGNGATVKEDVPDNGVVRAGGVWPD
jgi:sugar O-acyltransferase (sialic acid O-acetyltransferase NeuD family)